MQSVEKELKGTDMGKADTCPTCGRNEYSDYLMKQNINLKIDIDNLVREKENLKTHIKRLLEDRSIKTKIAEVCMLCTDHEIKLNIGGVLETDKGLRIIVKEPL